jgi:hypothetical protein
MRTSRDLLPASALAWLIEKEGGGDVVRQSYFADHEDRSTHVQVSRW